MASESSPAAVVVIALGTTKHSLAAVLSDGSLALLCDLPMMSRYVYETSDTAAIARLVAKLPQPVRMATAEGPEKLLPKNATTHVLKAAAQAAFPTAKITRKDQATALLVALALASNKSPLT